MSVYIKGMEMPKGKYDCPFSSEFSECTLCEDLPLCAMMRMGKDCPLIPVPDHGRLIDAGKIGLTDFEIILCQADENRYKSALQMLLEKIEKMPTIIPADKEKKNG